MRAAGLLLLLALLAPAVAAQDQVRIAFALRESDTVIEGDLAPGQSVAYEVPLDAPNLTRVTFSLTWSETQDLTGLSGPDSFHLSVSTPQGRTAGETSGSRGALEVASDANELPASAIVPASEAAERMAAATTHAGQGAWRATVRLDDAGGALDRGNHHRLTVRALRYEAVPLTPATGGPDFGARVASPPDWPGAAALLGVGACILAGAGIGQAVARRRARKARSALPPGDNTPLAKR